MFLMPDLMLSVAWQALPQASHKRLIPDPATTIICKRGRLKRKIRNANTPATTVIIMTYEISATIITNEIDLTDTRCREFLL